MARPRNEIAEGVGREMRALAEFLRDLLDEREITQRALATAMRFPPQRLSDVLRGEALPLLETVEHMVDLTVPEPRRHMMRKRAERLYKAAEAAPRTPALVRSERQVESLLAGKERLREDLDALRKDSVLLVMFLMRVIARLDRQTHDLTVERNELRRADARYAEELDRLRRELWRTGRQREQAGQKLETAQEQRADTEQRYVAAQLEIDELRKELAKLRAEREADDGPVGGAHTGEHSEKVTDASDDIDEALTKIDVVLHTQAETMRRLSEPDGASPDCPADNPATGDDGSAPKDSAEHEEPAPPPEGAEETAATAPSATAAEEAGVGPLHLLRLADSLWRMKRREDLAALMERAVSLQTPEEIETTSVLLKGLRDGYEIHSSFKSVLLRANRSPRPPDRPVRHRSARPTDPAGFVTLTVSPHAYGTVRPCPLEEAPDTPPRIDGAARTLLHREWENALLPPGVPRVNPPLLEQEDSRGRLFHLLSRGRSVRLTGARGSGRTTLLDRMTRDCADLAPDGVVRLDGHGKTPSELLYELCALVFDLRGHRPGGARLRKLLASIGAVVLIDDLEFGGAELEEFLDATPECATLFVAAPETPVPYLDTAVEEVYLAPLSEQAGLDLVRWCAGRELTENEVLWAYDVWFVSDGAPLRLVRAGALLRHRSNRALPPAPQEAARTASLVSALSDDAREVLLFAVALDGEVPHHGHLPALLNSPDAGSAVVELVLCGLVTAVGDRHRLADLVAPDLRAAGFAEGTVDRLSLMAERYAGYVGHPDVTPRQAVRAAPVVLSLLAGADDAVEDAHARTLVRLARAASAKFAAAGAWDLWRRTLHRGLGAARQLPGAKEDMARFLHDLGLLFLCRGEYGPARTTLEEASGLRTLSGSSAEVWRESRRALALLTERRGGEPVATKLCLAGSGPV